MAANIELSVGKVLNKVCSLQTFVNTVYRQGDLCYGEAFKSYYVQNFCFHFDGCFMSNTQGNTIETNWSSSTGFYVLSGVFLLKLILLVFEVKIVAQPRQIIDCDPGLISKLHDHFHILLHIFWYFVSHHICDCCKIMNNEMKCMLAISFI